MDKEQYFENAYTKMWIDNGILVCNYTPGLIITLDIARECIAERLKFTKGETYPMLCDIRTVKKTYSDARKYMSKDDGVKCISAGAFMVKTQIEKFLANAFLKINKPPLPAKLFTDTKEAVKWLEQFKHFQ